MSLSQIIQDEEDRERFIAMQKRHYERLAAVIKEIDAHMPMVVTLTTEQHANVMEHVASRIGLMLAKDNPAFDSHRFYHATGLEFARFRGDAKLPSR